MGTQLHLQGHSVVLEGCKVATLKSVTGRGTEEGNPSGLSLPLNNSALEADWPELSHLSIAAAKGFGKYHFYSG